MEPCADRVTAFLGTLEAGEHQYSLNRGGTYLQLDLSDYRASPDEHHMIGSYVSFAFISGLCDHWIGQHVWNGAEWFMFGENGAGVVERSVPHLCLLYPHFPFDIHHQL